MYMYMYLHVIDTLYMYMYLHVIDTCTVYNYNRYIVHVHVYLPYSVLHFTEKKREDTLIIQIEVVKTLQCLILTHLLFPVTPLVKKIERVSNS